MAENNNSSLKGQCLCGRIKYEVDALETRMGHCHCSMCRKFHGAAFATLGEAKAENFRWVSGKQYLKTYTAPNHTKRQFCEHCGSSLTFAPAKDDQKRIEFSLSTLDTAIELKPDAHIYTDNKANWYEIEDGLPQYAQGRDSKVKC